MGVREGGNVVFDTSEYHVDKMDFKKTEKYSLDIISNLVDSEWESYPICEAFSKFSFKWDKNDRNNQISEPNSPDEYQPLEMDDDPDAYDYETFNNFAENLQAKDDHIDFVNNEDEEDLISKILGEVGGAILPGMFLKNIYIHFRFLIYL